MPQRNLKNIRHADHTLSIVWTVIKLQEVRNKVIKETGRRISSEIIRKLYSSYCPFKSLLCIVFTQLLLLSYSIYTSTLLPPKCYFFSSLSTSITVFFFLLVRGVHPLRFKINKYIVIYIWVNGPHICCPYHSVSTVVRFSLHQT